MRQMRARRALASGALVAIAVAGCTNEAPVDGDPSAEPSASVDLDATEAAELRLRLEQQFALFSAATVAVVREPQGSVEAATAAFERSVDELAGSVEEAYDRQAAQDLVRIAGRYPNALADHAEAVRTERRPATSRQAVMRLPMELAVHMASVTDDGMEEEGTAALVRAPTLSLLQVAAAEAEGDFETAYARQREAYAAMVSVGRAFAAGISEQQPDTYPGLRNTGAIELQSALQQLLGEHAVLAGDVLRRGLRSARDFDAAAAALNGNTEDLTTALDSIYGDDATQFGVLWRERISTLAESAVAISEKRTKRAARLRATLARTDAELAGELASMTEDRIAEEDAVGHLRSLTRNLLQHAAAAAAKEFDRAHEAAGGAHADGAALAEVVASGIAEHRPADFPAR